MAPGTSDESATIAVYCSGCLSKLSNALQKRSRLVRWCSTRYTRPTVHGVMLRVRLRRSFKPLLCSALHKRTQVPHARRGECALHQAAHAGVILAVEKVDRMREFVARGAPRKKLMKAFRNWSGAEAAVTHHRVCRGIADYTGDA